MIDILLSLFVPFACFLLGQGKTKAAAVMNMEDDILSYLTSASGKQAPGFSSRTNNIDGSCNNIQGGAPPPPKKKKGIPCNPAYPDAEVVALSPKSLLATNKFTCEVCNKGFQRDQNLQLHRRGHNLPWKLKQRPKSEHVRRKVYLCPEPTCAHHDPSRALGDLTGIKKHFCRKHGEKRWKCDRCEKKYAVLSDWKAHSKVCGTREYKCDCGTVFSRRDSFITHRAFCDTLTQEKMMKLFALRQPSPPPLPQFMSLTNTIFAPTPTHPPLNLHDHFFNHGNGFPPLPLPLPFVKTEPEHAHLPVAAFSKQQQNFCFLANPNPSASSSATASFLQEDAMMGSTTVSDPSAIAGHVNESFMLQDTSMSMTAMMMMNSLVGMGFECDKGMEGMMDPKGREDHHVDGNLGMTRDFLSLSRDLVGMHGDDDDISCMQHLQKGVDHHQKQNSSRR